jgi:asparagine synthase (glutamine-hydrolysing)
MCGFAAILALGTAPVDRSALDRMGAVLAHRGPDDVGVYVAPNVGFVFRRLSILDVSDSGHQPMISDDGQYVVVFNGEIYNFLELRRELEGLGWRFTSTGDTEVLLASYRQWGSECVSKFNGMWAFLIHDLRRGVIVGSRDRLGVKPLYRYRTTTGVYFGSEIKAIRASGAYSGGVRWDRAAMFLLVGRADEVPEDGGTFYERIEQVPPGTVFELSTTSGQGREWRFWSIPTVARPGSSDGAPPDRVAALFTDSVNLRLRSDVPVGVSMSGGLDSTAVMCVMATALANAGGGVRPQPLRAFCYHSADFDESKYVAATLQQTGAELHPVQVDPVRMWDGLASFLWHHDEPVHSMTALVGYEVYRTAAAAGVKVVLGGQGADETAAGYPSYFRDYWRELAATGGWSRLRREMSAYSRAHGEAQLGLLRQTVMGTVGSLLRGLPLYRARVERRNAQRLRSNPWFTADVTAQVSEVFEAPSARLDAALRWSVERAPLPLYLRVEDRNSMAHSVEARLPFMDYRLVEYLFSLPSYWKLRGEWNKYVLREALRDRIPPIVRERVDKMGFPAPAKRWFAGPLYEPMRDLLASRSTRERGLYDLGRIGRDLDRHAAGEIDVSSQLFNIAQLETLAGLDAAKWTQVG